MNAVWNRRKGTRIHLYEHIDTWRQLNLDDAGHAYEYCFLPGSAARDRDPHFGGHYRPHRSLAAALHHLDLDLVGLWRRVPHTR